MQGRRLHTFLPVIISIVLGIIWAISAPYAPRNESYTPWRDEVEFHYPTIEQFAADFPKVHLENYNVASTPGYHLVMAAIYRVQPSHQLLLAVNGLISGLCLYALFWACNRVSPRGWIWGLVILLSPNFHYSALYLRSDNASWLFVFLIVGLAMQRRFDFRSMLIGGVLLFCLAIFRHVHIWTAAVLWGAALFDQGKLNFKRGTQMILLTLPALAVVGYFVMLWHGLVPPHFQTVRGQPLPEGHSHWQHEGPNWAVPMFIMAVMGLMLVFFILLLRKHLHVNAQVRRAILIAIAIMLPIATLPKSSFDNQTQGRYSGLWNVAQKLPAPADRSILIVPLSVIGGALFSLLFTQFDRRRRWIILATLLPFIAAQTANAMAWQKYYEPFLLGWLAILAGIIWNKNASAEAIDQD